MDQIIHSLLETDMYKLSMGQAIYHHFSGLAIFPFNK